MLNNKRSSSIFFSLHPSLPSPALCRKVADVRREKELAERRKNEPQLGTTQDHLVRKIFSKFRRAQQTAQLTKEPSQNSDVEKGDTDPETKKVMRQNLSERFR